MKHQYIYFITILLSGFWSCQPASSPDKEEISVFCAAGLTDIISELQDSFEMDNNTKLKINLASSGTLARQIAQGNRADIYISASKRWATYADSLELFAERKKLYKNRLVFIAPKTSTLDTILFTPETNPENLFETYLSVGDPAHVPAGKYAKESLMMLGWYENLKTRILPARDVRSALMVVELGECELGIVYLSDALRSEKVKILGIVPESLHTPIIFEALITREAGKQAENFYTMLSAEKYSKLWTKHGLTTVED